MSHPERAPLVAAGVVAAAAPAGRLLRLSAVRRASVPAASDTCNELWSLS